MIEVAGTMGSRCALLIATDTYSDERLRQLRAPAADVEGLSTVLSDPAIGGYAVDVRRNAAQPEVNRAIEDFFVEANPDDLLLLYVSGHGVKDLSGALFLPMANSEQDRLRSTAVSAQFIRDQMAGSRARQIMVWLDCCFAGAFPPGLRPRADHRVDVLAQLSGRGCAVMTSSAALEYAFEPSGEAAMVDAVAEPSVFTGALIKGLRTGEADRNGDGLVDIDELYDYTFDRVRETTPHQTPQRMFDLGGTLYVATSVRGRRPDPALPTAPLEGTEKLAVGIGSVAETQAPANPKYRRRRLVYSALFAVILLTAAAILTAFITRPPADNVTAVAMGKPMVVDGDVTALAYGEVDGKPIVVSGSFGDNSVRVWNLSTHQPIAQFSRPTSPHCYEPEVCDPHTVRDYTYVNGIVRVVAFGQVAGKPVIVAGSGDGTVRVWDPVTHQPVGEPFFTGGVMSMAAGQVGGTTVVISGGKPARVWDLVTQQPIGPPLDHHPDATVWSMAVGQMDAKPVVVTGESDGAARIWDLTTQQPVGQPLTGHTNRVESVVIGQLNDRSVIVSADDDGIVRVWDLATQQSVGGSFAGYTGFKSSIAIGQLDGKPVVISGGMDGTVRIWDLATHQPIGLPLAGHRGSVLSVTVGQIDGNPVIISGGDDHTIRVWSLAAAAKQ